MGKGLRMGKGWERVWDKGRVGRRRRVRDREGLGGRDWGRVWDGKRVEDGEGLGKGL